MWFVNKYVLIIHVPSHVPKEFELLGSFPFFSPRISNFLTDLCTKIFLVRDKMTR